MRVGVIGCGRWGRFILRDLVALGCEVVVVARSDASRHRAREGGASRIVRDVAALDGVAGVVVATPTSSHYDATDAALDLGVPVFVEKPLTADPGSAQALANRAPEWLFVMDKWRYHPAVEEMARMRLSGEFGPLEMIRTRRLSWGQSHDDVDGVWVLIPHDLAIVREIAGVLPPSVGATGLVGRKQDAALTALLGGPVRCVLEVSSLAPTPERRITVQFSEAIVEMTDPYATRITVTRVCGDGTPEAREIPDEMPLLKELAAFLAHLAGGPAPRSSAAEGVEAVTRIAELRAMAGI